jgi:hypothetical protein
MRYRTSGSSIGECRPQLLLVLRAAPPNVLQAYYCRASFILAPALLSCFHVYTSAAGISLMAVMAGASLDAALAQVWECRCRRLSDRLVRVQVRQCSSIG